MDITYLPNDVINLIVAYSHRYNLIYVNNHFKNMFYKKFTKCDKCNKIIKINNDNLWIQDESMESCHSKINYYENTVYSRIFNKDHYNVIKNRFDMLGSISNICNVTFTDVLTFKTIRGTTNVEITTDPLENLHTNLLNKVYKLDLSKIKSHFYAVSIYYYSNKYTNNIFVGLRFVNYSTDNSGINAIVTCSKIDIPLEE